MLSRNIAASCWNSANDADTTLGWSCRKFSKIADNKFQNAKKPVVAIIDEICQSSDLDKRLVWPDTAEALLLLVILGSLNYLRGTVKTYNYKTDKKKVNSFAKQMIISLSERLWSRDFETYRLRKQITFKPHSQWSSEGEKRVWRLNSSYSDHLGVGTSFSVPSSITISLFIWSINGHKFIRNVEALVGG